ncbi:hypothetical protein GCM10010415_10630 [Streptomyces atrovirens]
MLDGSDSAQGGEGRLGVQPFRIVSHGDQESDDAVRTDAHRFEQLWGMTLDKPGRVSVQLVGLRGELFDALGDHARPTESSRLSPSRLRSALKRAGRARGIEEEADRLRGVLRAEYAHQPAARGRPRQAASRFAEAVDAGFREHPDAEIPLSFPGLGVQLAARVLAETGDDRNRFADARGLKA